MTTEELNEQIRLNKEKIKTEKLSEIDFLVDDDYFCETCGNIGKEHPKTGMCWECGADDWEPMPGKARYL